MTDQTTQEPEALFECSMCGRNGYPPLECQDCHGRAAVQPRSYTLSDIRSGRAPDDTERDVNPKIIHIPGSN